jgi:hypothetical protein
MKILLRLLPLLVALSASVFAANDKVIAAVRAADDVRVAATIGVDQAKLAAVFSDELRYAHSSGVVDSKASYTKKLVDGTTKYVSIDYVERNFTEAAPGIVLMTGRAHFKSVNSGQPVENFLGFLGVWREEHGQWRFLAWQSCKLPPPEAAPVK